MDIGDPSSLSDAQLLRQGRDALRLGRWRQACDALAEYCSRSMRLERPIPSGVLALYGLAIGHVESVREGIGICFQALVADRRNPDAYLCLARLYVLADAKRNAIDVLSQGLRVSRNHRALNAFRRELGVRQARPIPFLRRGNAVNVRLGRVIRKLKKNTPTAIAVA